MKILIDMNLSPVWAEVLAPHCVEAVHWSSIGAVNALDSDIMEFARVNGYAILTHDLDFSAMLWMNRGKGPSIIQLRTGDIIPDNTTSLVISALEQWAAEIETGAILTIDINKARLRILPL